MALWVKVVLLGNSICPNSKDQCLGVPNGPRCGRRCGLFVWGDWKWLVALRWVFKGRVGKSHVFFFALFFF